MMRSTLGKWRALLTLCACVMLLVGSPASGVYAQDAEPTKDPAQLVDPTLPEDSTPEPTETPTSVPAEVEGTPEASTSSSTGATRVDTATTPGAPATLAHGLAYYDGDDLVWQVQEIEVPVISKAEAEVSDPSIVIQREGQSIIRNNVTGRRALLSPGEAFFITADDSYTIMAEDDGSVIWKFSLVDPDDVASDAFYESPALTAVDDDTYDLQLIRYVLQPSDTADLPSNNGAGMVMPGSGDVQVDHGGQLSLLGMDGSHGQGQVLRQPSKISNTGSEPVVVFYLMIGDTVSDDSAAAPQGNSSSANSSGNSSSSSSSNSGSDSSESTGSSETTSPSDQPSGGPYRAQINVYAQSDIWLTVTVDGTVWFDGNLPAGKWSGPMPGSVFEVYTSSGANTLFENACGDQFYMDDSAGEAWYTLTADANSCPPPGE
ncbi:MAG: hypothetical protein KC435_13050 [Thermomicrobiales bacterium]|nr:hypothetical protein [Thermomicrobiales bacterium]